MLTNEQVKNLESLYNSYSFNVELSNRLGHGSDKRTYISKMWTLSAVLDILGYQAEFKERDEKYGTEYDCFTIIECKKANKEK